MAPIEKDCPTWPITTTSVRPVLAQHSISSTKGADQALDGGGTAPVSSVNVTFIPKQYLVLGWLGGSLLAGDQDSEWGGTAQCFCLFSALLTLELHVCMALSAGWLQIFGLLNHSIWWPLT